MTFPKLKNKAILAPMAGVTDVAFRALCKRYGAGMTYTEFVSSSALIRERDATLKMIRVDESEKPVGVQLFGSEVEEIVLAGKILEKRFDVIDVNCGCPAFKVIKTGAGSEMLKNPDKIAEFVSKLAHAIKKPVSVKIRTGIDSRHKNALEVAKKVEEAGAAAITVHGRTQEQGYSGKADWDLIKQVKESVNIPVIGNGDVFTPEDFKSWLEFSNVDGIMIGRAAMTNPFIFQQIQDYMKTGVYGEKNKKVLFFEYLELAEKYDIHFLQVKNHAVSFTKGLVGGSSIRQKLVRTNDIKQLSSLMEKI